MNLSLQDTNLKKALWITQMSELFVMYKGYYINEHKYSVKLNLNVSSICIIKLFIRNYHYNDLQNIVNVIGSHSLAYLEELNAIASDSLNFIIIHPEKIFTCAFIKNVFTNACFTIIDNGRNVEHIKQNNMQNNITNATYVSDIDIKKIYKKNIFHITEKLSIVDANKKRILLINISQITDFMELGTQDWFTVLGVPAHIIVDFTSLDHNVIMIDKLIEVALRRKYNISKGNHYIIFSI